MKLRPSLSLRYEELARPFKRACASGAGSAGAGCVDALDDAAFFELLTAAHEPLSPRAARRMDTSA